LTPDGQNVTFRPWNPEKIRDEDNDPHDVSCCGDIEKMYKKDESWINRIVDGTKSKDEIFSEWNKQLNQ